MSGLADEWDLGEMDWWSLISEDELMMLRSCMKNNPGAEYFPINPSYTDYSSQLLVLPSMSDAKITDSTILMPLRQLVDPGVFRNMN